MHALFAGPTSPACTRSWTRGPAAPAGSTHRRPREGGRRASPRPTSAPPSSRGGARPSHLRRAGRGRGCPRPPGRSPGARAEPCSGARAAGGTARRRQWERRGRRRSGRRWLRSSGPRGDGRPRHEPRSRAPPCAARGPRRAASASPGPRPGAGDALPGLRMMVDCQVSARARPWPPSQPAGVERGPHVPGPHPIRRGGSTAPGPR